MRKSLLVLSAILGLCACDKVPENVAGVDLKQVSELGANLLENNIKAQCENAFNEFESDDDSHGKKRKFRLKDGNDTDGNGDESGSLLDMVFTAEQRQVACDCAIEQVKKNASANQLQKITDGGTQAMKTLVSTAVNVCVSEINKTVDKKQ